MLFDNITQLAVLALVLLAGWLFGFASNHSGRKWRRAYRAEVAARRHERDELEAQLRQADERTAGFERDRTVADARPVVTDRTAQPVTVADAPAPLRSQSNTVAAASAARAAFGPAGEPIAADANPLPIARDRSGDGDDLTRLRGVDDDLAERLRAEGVARYADLGGLSDQEELALERRLDLPAGYLMKEQLREQAQLLADGRTDEHRARFD